MVRRHHQGFAVPQVVLMLLVVALVATVGWYVWRHQGVGDDVKTTVESTNQSEESAYKSVKLNVQFRYPAEWGKALLDSWSTVKADAGAYTIGFTNNPKFTGVLQKRGWQLQKDDFYYTKALTTYNACQSSSAIENVKAVYIIYETADVCVAEVGYAQDTGDLTDPAKRYENVHSVIIQKKLTNSPAPAIEFFGKGVSFRGKVISEANLKAYVDKNPMSQYVDLAKSIKPVQVLN